MVLPFSEFGQEYMKRHEHFRSEFQKFSWAQIDWEGTFSHRIFEARLNAGMQFGFWSVPAGRETHDVGEHPPHTGYIHGEMMLGRNGRPILMPGNSLT